MRLHISLDDAIVRALDDRVGRRRRSAFIASAVVRALDDERRWRDIENALGAVPSDAHEWHSDPAGWVRAQRSADRRRVG